MARTSQTSLTEALIRSLKPKPQPYEMGDRGCIGLRLRIEPSGHAGWYGIIRTKRHHLGSWPTMSLREARLAVDDLRVSGNAPTPQASPEPISIGRFYQDTFLHSLADLASPDLATRYVQVFCRPIWDQPPEALTRAYIYTRRSELRSRYAAKTLQTAAWALSRFANCLILHGHLTLNPLSKLKHLPIDNPRKAFDTEDLNKVCTVAAKWLTDKVYRRRLFGLFILVISTTGARAGEIINLNTGNISLSDQEYASFIRVQPTTSKTGTYRTVPLKTELVQILKYWLPLFTSTTPFLCFKGSGYNVLFKKMLDEAKVDRKFTVHSFRHSMAERIVNNLGTYQAMQLLGHASIKTLMIYLRPKAEDVMKLAQAMSVDTEASLQAQREAVSILNTTSRPRLSPEVKAALKAKRGSI